MDSTEEIKSFADLKKQSQSKKNLKLNLYEQFLTLILKKISNVSTMLNQAHLVYQVPEAVIGHPFYEINDCCMWLKENLIKKGANEVNILESNILVITWDLS